MVLTRGAGEKGFDGPGLALGLASTPEVSIWRTKAANSAKCICIC